MQDILVDMLQLLDLFLFWISKLEVEKENGIVWRYFLSPSHGGKKCRQFWFECFNQYLVTQTPIQLAIDAAFDMVFLAASDRFNRCWTPLWLDLQYSMETLILTLWFWANRVWSFFEAEQVTSFCYPNGGLTKFTICITCWCNFLIELILLQKQLSADFLLKTSRKHV